MEQWAQEPSTAPWDTINMQRRTAVPRVYRGILEPAHKVVQHHTTKGSQMGYFLAQVPKLR